MTEQFRDCFVGEKGYDALKKQMRSGNEFCTDIAKCLQERSDAEIVYVRALQKTSDTLQKLAGRTKGTLSTAFTLIAAKTSKEIDAHSALANILLSEIVMPMKNLAEIQYKERKSIEETLNGKFKEWNIAKDIDNKYRSRQFEKSREIEGLYLKISELPKGSRKMARDSAKESTGTIPLVMGCVLPAGRHTSASEKIENTLQRAEQDLEKIERKYHDSTKNVELARQSCAAEMCRSCDKMQKMEFERLNDMDKYIHIYANSIRTLTETMNQISHELNSIQVVPNEDIIMEARSNLQTTEIEILLYDIYAEHTEAMGEQRRILSLMRWIEILKKDIDIQRRSNNNASLSFLPLASLQKSLEDQSLDDDRDFSSDGAMCSTRSSSKTVSAASYHNDSSSSSNDDDGAMCHEKDKRRGKKKTEGLSNEIFLDRPSIHLLQYLYEASLYKIESVYNRIKKYPEKQYEYAQRFAKTYNDKGDPTTLIRIPFKSSTETPPSAPSSIKYFAEAMPMFIPMMMEQRPMVYTAQQQAPPMGITMNDTQMKHTQSDNQMATTRAAYPVLMTQSTEPYQPKPVKCVKVIYPYNARHSDELTLKQGDIIVLHERRRDQWCKGDLEGRIGLFPGTHVEEV
ncbi:unnamed protein product [Rotaria sp. Silwood1]|nr:unnamed protein product [Rotaria sp. Silwood1]